MGREEEKKELFLGSRREEKEFLISYLKMDYFLYNLYRIFKRSLFENYIQLIIYLPYTPNYACIIHSDL